MNLSKQTKIAYSEQIFHSIGEFNLSFGMQSQTKMCDSSCPTEHSHDKFNIHCRKCAQLFHLPCVDIIQPKEKIFVNKNVVFLCDSCLTDIDSIKSPKRKQNTQLTPKNSNTNQMKLSQNSSGGITLHRDVLQRSSNSSNSSKLSNGQIESILSINTTNQRKHSEIE